MVSHWLRVVLMRGFVVTLMSWLVLVVPVAAEVTVVDGPHPLRVQADVRLRYESDWDSRQADGRPRDDRQRLRARARLGFTLDLSDDVVVGVRARTGSRASQQSPHVTFHDFDDNPKGAAQAMLDKWYLAARGTGSWAWVGRNAFPFWKQNELFWDDDVTVAGAALGATVHDGDGATTRLLGGYFALPDGGVDFNGNLVAGQVVYERNGDVGWTLAVGGYRLVGRDGAEHLLTGNGARDYAIINGGAQLRASLLDRPLRLGVDAMTNVEDYDASELDRFAAAHADDTEGIVLSASWGSTRRPSDYLLGYYYARIDALALNASYAQDDWVRWGSATQTTSSDLVGHELRFAMKPWRALELVARVYLVDAISSEQDGKRFRLDFNYSF